MRSTLDDRSDRTAALVSFGIVGGYNLIQNLALPERAYVPANLMVAAGLVAFARRSRCDRASLGLGWPGVRSGVREGVLAVAAVAVVASAAVADPKTRRYLRDERAHGHPAGEACYRALVRFPLGTAMFEEVVFRGVLTALARRRSKRWGATWSAVAFGLWHIIPTWQASRGNPATGHLSTRQRAVTTLAGASISAAVAIALQRLADRSAGLSAPWMAHAAFNSLGYVAGRVSWRLP